MPIIPVLLCESPTAEGLLSKAGQGLQSTPGVSLQGKLYALPSKASSSTSGSSLMELYE
jgi:hypothetical protein